jgi:hypothetical protein
MKSNSCIKKLQQAQRSLELAIALCKDNRFTIGTPQIKIEEEELIAMIWLGFSS